MKTSPPAESPKKQLIVEWSNRLEMIMPALSCLVFVLLFTISFLIGLLVNIVVWWLFLELTWNSVIVVRLEDRTLTISKPGRRRSLLSRKRHHLVIGPEEWDTLLYRRGPKNATSFYFRKEHVAQYFFVADGFSRLPDKLKEFFPEKEIRHAANGFPKGIIRKLRKRFPERVL